MPAPVSIAIGSRRPAEPACAADRLRVAVGDAQVDLWVAQAGLACCAVEVNAALARLPAADAVGDPHLSVLVVAGTVTDKMAPGVLALYGQLPAARSVLSFGSCANSGGPYWDSYCVTKGVDQLMPVDLYVPGCPPRPEALLDGLATLAAGVR